MARRAVKAVRLGASLAAAAWLLWAAGGVRAQDAAAPDEAPRDPAGMALDYYQEYLSSLRHVRCRFQPSCSAYAREAIARYGLFAGSARAADRLVRCNGSAAAFYPRRPDGRLDDPVAGAPTGATAPRLAPWLLPSFTLTPPPSDSGLAARLDEIVAFARSLAVDRDCWRAETEYLRAAHLAGADAWRRWSLYQIGACYFEAGAWTDAQRNYLQAGMLAADPADRRLAAHLLAASLFNAGRYRAAAERLAGPDLTARALAVRGLCRMARGEWTEATGDFAAGAAVADSLVLAVRLERMGALAATGPDLPGRSPGFAMFLSAVVPGTGQMYAGRAEEGIRHLIFNGILIYTVVKLIQNEHYPAAGGVALIGLPFYVGNVKGAGAGARMHNRDRRLELTAQAIADADRGSP